MGSNLCCLSCFISPFPPSLSSGPNTTLAGFLLSTYSKTLLLLLAKASLWISIMCSLGSGLSCPETWSSLVRSVTVSSAALGSLAGLAPLQLGRAGEGP